MKKFLNNYTLFFTLVLIIGTIFSFFVPAYQIPDEKTHLCMIYNELNQNVEECDIFYESFDTIRITNNENEKIDVDTYFNLNKKANIDLQIKIPNIKIFRHLPQSIAVIIGNLFNLPIFVTLQLAESFALIFYAFICTISLKLIPFKRNIMAFLMLLPICIQQMGSLSYDAVLIPLCFLLISYIMYLKFTKLEVNTNDFIKIFLLICCIAIIKVPYILLGLLVFIIGKEKLNCKIGKIVINENFINKHKKKILFFLIIIFIIGIFVITKINYGKVLISMLLNPIAAIKILFITLKEHFLWYIASIIGSFGWFDTNISLWIIAFVCISGLIICFLNIKNKNIEEQPFKKKEIFFILYLFFIMFLVIIIALFEWSTKYIGVDTSDWTISQYSNYIRNNQNDILGVQGRYFVPILPLLVLPIFSNKITNFFNKFNYKIIIFIYYIVMILYMFFTILYRYWI